MLEPEHLERLSGPQLGRLGGEYVRGRVED